MPADKPIVFFDVGGTLIEVVPSIGSVYAAACGERGLAIGAHELQRAFDAAWRAISEEIPRGADRYSHFEGGEHEWWERVSVHAFDLCGLPADRRPTVDRLRSAFARAEAWTLYPEARGALEALRREGCRLGVISNWDSRLPALLSSLDLDDHFEAVTYSAAERIEKPHPAIFDAALRALEADPSRAFHVGDRLEEDYLGAREAGLRALLVCRQPAGPELMDEVRRWGHESDLVADLAAAVDRILS